MFKNTQSVISEPLKFKAKLAIGEDAYTSLRLKNNISATLDVIGIGTAAGAGVAVAESSIVASTFFAPTGFLATFGFGVAVTPVGWVVAAAVISAGTWAGVSRYVKKQVKDKVTVIPEFINTPMDVLAIALFDLMAPLALKVAIVDNYINESERLHISRYFIKEWGYNENFVADATSLIESNITDFKIKELASNIAAFQKDNPDCNHQKMSDEIISFLTDVMESDGQIDEREEFAIEKIKNIFEKPEKVSKPKSTSPITKRSMEKLVSGKDFLSKKLKSITKKAKKVNILESVSPIAKIPVKGLKKGGSLLSKNLKKFSRKLKK